MQREVTRSPGDPEIRAGLASPLSRVMGQVAPGAGREEPLTLPARAGQEGCLPLASPELPAQPGAG